MLGRRTALVRLCEHRRLIAACQVSFPQSSLAEGITRSPIYSQYADMFAAKVGMFGAAVVQPRSLRFLPLTS